MAQLGINNNRSTVKVYFQAALEQINKDAKELIAMKVVMVMVMMMVMAMATYLTINMFQGSWRRAGAQPKKAGVQREMNNMRVRKLSLEMLGWGR